MTSGINWRLPLCAVLSYSLSFSTHAELIILPGDTYINNSGYNNYDLIDNQGVFENNSVVTSLATSLFDNQGLITNNYEMIFAEQSTLSNSGDFQNYADLYLNDLASLQNSGNFYNYGRLTQSEFATFVNDGLFDNQGIIDAQLAAISNTGTFDNTGAVAVSSFANSGVLNNDSQLSGYFIDNQLGGLIVNSSSGIISIENDFNNAGSIDNSGTINTGGQGSALLNNAGDFYSNGQFVVYDEFHLINSGNFYNNTELAMYAPGSELVNSGFFDNAASVYVEGRLINEAGGVFNNIIGYLTEVAGTLDNRGEFNNGSGVVLRETYDPATGMIFPGTLNNSGVYNNSGYIEAPGVGGLVLNNSGTFNNAGDIHAYDGVVVNNSGMFFNNAFMELNSLGNSGTFENNYSLTVHGELVNDVAGIFNNQTGLTMLEGYDPVTGAPTQAHLLNNGVFNHQGSILTGGAEGLRIDNSGEFNNNGNFGPAGYLEIHNAGVFNNNVYLQMNAAAPIGDNIVNTGTFNNNLSIYGASFIENSGSFENNGTVAFLDTLTNNVVGTFNNYWGNLIQAFGVLDNQGEFNNLGFIELYQHYDFATGLYLPGQLDNSGVFNHSADISGDGPLIINNSGLFNNNGSFTINDRLSIDNVGVFNNNTPLDMHGVVVAGTLANSGTFNNNASLTGVKLLQNSGTFENSYGVSVSERLVNTATGIFNNISGYITEVFGVLDNQGVFNNQDYASLQINGGYDPATSRTVAAELNNTGVFNHRGNIDSAAPGGLTLNNAGEFNNQGSFQFSDSLAINNSGVFNNDAVMSTGYSGPQGISLINSGTLNNNNVLDGVEYLENSGVFENNRGVSVLGWMVNDATGVFNNVSGAQVTISGSLENSGEFNNQGIMEVLDAYDPMTGALMTSELNNTGVFNNQEYAAVRSGFGVMLNNSGEFNNLGEFTVNQNLAINNSGTFNNGIFFGPPAALQLGYNSSLNNLGTFNNYRGITGIYGADPRIQNAGVMNNYASINGIREFSNSGTVNNYIYIEISNFNSMVNTASGVINNGVENSSAVIQNFNAMDNRGTLNNNLYSRIENYYGAIIDNSGSIINEGSIVGDGDISNSGILRNYNDFSIQGKLTNSGSLLNDGYINGYMDIDNSGSMQNNRLMWGLNTVVSSGEFINNGTVQADNIQVTGGVLKGDGIYETVNGMVITEAGTLAPGDLFGLMQIRGDLVLDGTLATEFYLPGGPVNNLLFVNGDVKLGVDSVLDISFLGDNNLSLGSSYDVMFADTISGDFGNFYYDPLGDNSLALQWEIFSDYSQDILRLSVVSAVPLPAAVWLFLTGALGMVVTARRRHHLH